MTLNVSQKEQIAHAVIKVLYSRFNSFPTENGSNRNAPFHIAFLQAFKKNLENRVKNIPDFIGLSSWMQGLNTSLGQSFFESVAHILCDGEKREFKGNTIFVEQKMIIGEIMTDLKNGECLPSLKREDNILANKANGAICFASNFTADCFYETDTDIVAIELKSVRPNSGEMKGEKQKILEGKAILKKLYPTKNVKYVFGFPFDPTSEEETSYDKTRFLKYLVEAEKFVAHDDFLIADELWSFLASTEKGTMQEIIDIINSIATPEFMDKFSKIQSKDTDSATKYKILSDWHLISEIRILNDVVKTKNNCRLYNQSIFKHDGSYNYKRLNLII